MAYQNTESIELFDGNPHRLTLLKDRSGVSKKTGKPYIRWDVDEGGTKKNAFFTGYVYDQIGKLCEAKEGGKVEIRKTDDGWMINPWPSAAQTSAGGAGAPSGESTPPMNANDPTPPQGGPGSAPPPTDAPPPSPSSASPADPSALYDKASQCAALLRGYVSAAPNVRVFKSSDSEYLPFVCWQFVAAMFGCSAGSGEVRDDGKKFTCTGFLFDANGNVISRCEAEVSRDEEWCKDKDEFAVLNFCQTRARAQVIRSVYGWVAELAGFSNLSAEEMTQVVEIPF